MLVGDTGYWATLANDYTTAGAGLSPHCLLLAMAVAEHETNNGRAWPGTFNFGAVQLRACTPEELGAYHSGALQPGDRISGNPGGVLHIDTHPTPAGPAPYPVWFVAFSRQVDGVTYFLRTLLRLTGGALTAPGANGSSVARAMYMHGYFEGAHPGARPYNQRKPPLLPAEEANVADYAAAIVACVDRIIPLLPQGWLPPPSGPALDLGTVADAERLPPIVA